MHIGMFPTWPRPRGREWTTNPRDPLPHSVEYDTGWHSRLRSRNQSLHPVVVGRSMVIIRNVRYVLVAVLLWPVASSAIVTCNVPDRSFRHFLQKFANYPNFQQSRIIFPLVHRFGDYTMTEPLIELWDLSQVKGLSYPLILSDRQRKAEGIEQLFVLTTRRYVEIVQDRPEADDYRMLYKFRRINGCWFLEEAHDKAL